jgi:hypothetical protein
MGGFGARLWSAAAMLPHVGGNRPRMGPRIHEWGWCLTCAVVGVEYLATSGYKQGYAVVTRVPYNAGGSVVSKYCHSDYKENLCLPLTP